MKCIRIWSGILETVILYFDQSLILTLSEIILFFFLRLQGEISVFIGMIQFGFYILSQFFSRFMSCIHDGEIKISYLVLSS